MKRSRIHPGLIIAGVFLLLIAVNIAFFLIAFSHPPSVLPKDPATGEYVTVPGGSAPPPPTSPGSP